MIWLARERSITSEQIRRGRRLEARTTWTCRRSARAKAATRAKGKGDKSAKPKECFYCGKPGHNKSECRNFSAALKKKPVQPDRAGRFAGVEVDPETGKRTSSGWKGTRAVNPAPGLDACLLYEDESDQNACLFPLPMIDESNDGPEDLMASSHQVLFLTREQQGQCAHRRYPN